MTPRNVASHKSVLDTPQRVRLWTIPSRPNTTTNPAAAIGGSGGGGGGGGPAIVRLEQLNPTMESGNIFEVHVKVGDTVSEDDVLYSIDLDKVWVDIHSPVAGTVTMLADIDTDCMVGEVIATISSAPAWDGTTAQTPETWRAEFDQNLELLQWRSCWGHSQHVFESMMSALPGDLVSSSWRAAAAHNAGCAALRLGKHDKAVKLFRRALHLRREETLQDFASVEVASHLGAGVSLLTQHVGRALGHEKRGLDRRARDHLTTAHTVVAQSGSGGQDVGHVPWSPETLCGLAAVRTTVCYYAALSELCVLSSGGDAARVAAQDAHASIERVTALLDEARSTTSPTLGSERARQLLEDVNVVYGTIVRSAVADAIAAGDVDRQIEWPQLTVTRAHFGGVIPFIALPADGPPAIEAVLPCTEAPPPERASAPDPASAAAACLRGSPFDLAEMLRQCCLDANKPLLAVTGSGLSRACGLPTRQELWSSGAFHRDLDVTASGRRERPERLWRLVHEFYKRVHFNPVPTAGHWALDRMVDRVPGGVVVTQNVDGLHRAGQVHEVHGSLLRFRCDHCGAVQPEVLVRGPHLPPLGSTPEARIESVGAMDFYQRYVPKLLDSDSAARWHVVCGACHTEGRVRPDVVLFGEGARIPASVMAADGDAVQAATFGAVVVVGTAGDVYPASAVAQHVAQRCSCPVAVIDPAATRLMSGSRCDIVVCGDADRVLAEVAAEYLRDAPLGPAPARKRNVPAAWAPVPMPAPAPVAAPVAAPIAEPVAAPASAIDVVISKRWGDGALSGPLAATIAKKQAEYEEKYGSGWLTKPP